MFIGVAQTLWSRRLYSVITVKRSKVFDSVTRLRTVVKPQNPLRAICNDGHALWHVRCSHVVAAEQLHAVSHQLAVCANLNKCAVKHPHQKLKFFKI